jgi:hypothetical protein
MREKLPADLTAARSTALRRALDQMAQELAGPGRRGAVERPQRFPMKIHFVWGFCVGA